MLIASVMLLLTMVIFFTDFEIDAPNERIFAKRRLKDHWWDFACRLQVVFSNPYLLCIALFIFLYTGVSSFVYFELKNLLSELARQGNGNLGANGSCVNILSISRLLVTGRIVSKLVCP